MFLSNFIGFAVGYFNKYKRLNLSFIRRISPSKFKLNSLWNMKIIIDCLSFNRQNDNEKLVLSRNGAINGMSQTHWKDMHILFFWVGYIVIDCARKLRFEKKQKQCTQRIPLVTHDDLYDRKASYKVKRYFCLLFMNNGDIVNYRYPTELCRRYLYQVKKSNIIYICYIIRQRVSKKVY